MEKSDQAILDGDTDAALRSLTTSMSLSSARKGGILGDVKSSVAQSQNALYNVYF